MNKRQCKKFLKNTRVSGKRWDRLLAKFPEDDFPDILKDAAKIWAILEITQQRGTR